MKIELISLLRCPVTGSELVLESAEENTSNVESGFLVSLDGQHRYAIVKGIPRFVPATNYADNFGFQWNTFRQTQLDSYSGQSISAERFWKSTEWLPSGMKDSWILDVGCGSGRFAEVALNAGAKVVALDYSSSVDACYANLKAHPNLHVIQGDIYSLPFAQNMFSYIYSLGVLQHTPDVAKAFVSLPQMLQEGGSLCVDYYAKTWKSILLPKYWLRPITKRIPKKTLFAFLRKAVPVMLPISRLIGMIPILGVSMRRLVPVANYYGVLPLNDEQQKEWALLDTFDWLSPEYDNPQTSKTVHLWMCQAGLKDIQVVKKGHLIARGKR